MYTGYLACDLAIKGLQQPGKNPTARGFIDGLHSWAPRTPPVSRPAAGREPPELWQHAEDAMPYLQFKNGKFVVMNKGKPVAGKLVGDPALIKANAEVRPPTSRRPPTSLDAYGRPESSTGGRARRTASPLPGLVCGSPTSPCRIAPRRR